jgi:hypothetical protein
LFEFVITGMTKKIFYFTIFLSGLKTTQKRNDFFSFRTNSFFLTF